MNSHTQGPWTCFPKFDTPNLYAVYDKDENFFDDGSINCSTQRANAHLIAAAPELLEALENALNVLAGIATGDLKTIERDSPAIIKARAAISKAKGE